MKQSLIMKRVWTRTALFIFFLFLLSSCGGTNRQPLNKQVSLADIQVLEMRTLETTFKAGLRILNPSETTLSIKGISCDLRIDGQHFASGLSGQQYEIPAYESAVIWVPVYASTLDMITSILKRIQKGQSAEPQAAPIKYELKGHLRVIRGNNGTKVKIPFDAQGELLLGGPEKSSA